MRRERSADAQRTIDAAKAGYVEMAKDLFSLWRDVAKGSIVQEGLAGLTVAAVALPLNLGLAVACKVPPISGLVAGAIGGAIAAIFGGSRYQVTGPAAALSVMILTVSTNFGLAGVAAAALIVGIVQLILAGLLAGRVMSLVPESVLAGFTTGVGIKLLDQQIPKVLGFDYKVFELAQMMHRPAWLHQVSWHAVVSGLIVVFFMVSMAKWKRIPAAIFGIAIVTFVSAYVGWDIERVGEIPDRFPKAGLPSIADERWLDLLVAAVPLGILASVETLLSARVVDRLAKAEKPHDPNLELFGQGLANIAVGFFSGMPVTGVAARSGVNVQSGAKTKLSALIHAAVLASIILFFGPNISKIPLAALAGVLCVVGVRLIEFGTFVHLFREEKIEAAAFLVTAAGTVTGHLVTGLALGIALSVASHYIHKKGPKEAEAEAARERRARGTRAVIDAEAAERPGVPRHSVAFHESPTKWLAHIRARTTQAKSSFVHGHASVIGRVVLGEHVHIAAGSSVRADEGTPFYIGDNTNVQDGVVIHALKDKHVVVGDAEWAVYIGRNVSMAHDALVHGPCFVGDDTFIGFKAVVHDSVIGPRCFIGIGAVVVGVEVPEGRFVPHGSIIDSADAVARLGPVTDAHREFNEDVVDVNRGLAVAYREKAVPAKLDRRLQGSGTAGWDPARAIVRDESRF